MIKSLYPFIFVLAMLSACTKEPAPVAPASNGPSTAKPIEATPSDEAPPPPGGVAASSAEQAAPVIETKAPAGPDEGVTPENFNTHLQGLQGAVDQYMQDQKRKPASFEEIIRAGYLEKLPPATKGKKYVLDPGTQQVKEVNQ